MMLRLKTVDFVLKMMGFGVGAGEFGGVASEQAGPPQLREG